jgi:signal transduction histidine kinase
MDLVVVAGAVAATGGTAAVVPVAARTLRQGRLPIAEALTAVLLFLSVDWAHGQWPTWQVVAVFFCWAALLVVYPDGRPRPTWTVFLLVGYGAVLVSGWASAGGFGSGPWPMLLLAGLAVAGGTQVWRYRRRSGPAEREATQWLLLGLVVTVTVLVSADLLGLTRRPDPDSWWWGLLRLVGMVLPLGAALGLVTTTLTSANTVLHRTAAGCTTGLGLAVLHRGADPHLTSGELTALLAVASPTLLLTSTRLLEPVVYGSGSRPVLRRLGDRLQATLGPDDVVRTVQEAVRSSLAVPRATVDLTHRGPVDAAAASLGGGHVFPVPYQGRHIATLVVSPRPAEPALTRRDRVVLAKLAKQAGPALHGAQVVHQLRAARERLVNAQEEERRRIRRDLHDDLGPSLAGLGLTASALRSHLHASPDELDISAARRLAEEITWGISEASALVRRVVYDLQPAGLGGRGLLATLQDRLTRPPVDDGMHVTLDADLGSVDLPAAVEVATARIITEAVGNARRHADASLCAVEVVRTAETLRIVVRDDGHGLAPGTPLGVGLRSIEERADELGESSELLSSPAGTTIRVVLPLTRTMSSHLP